MLPAGTVRTPWLNFTRAHCWTSSPLVGVAGEVDAGDRADAPLRVGQAARVAVHDRVVGHAAAERVVLRLGPARARARAARLRRRAGPPPRARGAPRRRSTLTALRETCPPREPSARRSSWSAASLIAFRWRSCSNCLPGGRDVGVPALGHPPARELHVALVERRLELQQEQLLLDVEDRRGHDPTTLASRGDLLSCVRMSSQYIFTMHRLSKLHPPDKTVLDEHHAGLLSRARRSACSATTAPASRRCCGSWPGVDQEYRGEAALAPGATRRDARAGAAPRRDQGRPGQRRGRRRRDQGAARPLQRAGRQLLRGDRRGVRRASRPRSKPPTPGTSTRSSNTRWTRCACRRPTPTSRTLSGGERRRVALCRLLLRAPDLLLLDEPTNHLDAESVAWLEQHLAEYKGTIVAVTHDRYFLDNVAGWILELDRGRGIPYEGNYSSWLEQKQARLAQEERTREGPPAHDRRRARMGAHEPQGPAHEVQGAPGPLRGAGRRGAQRQARRGPDPHPARARASARRCSTATRPAQGLRRAAADRVARPSTCRARASSA